MIKNPNRLRGVISKLFFLLPVFIITLSSPSCFSGPSKIPTVKNGYIDLSQWDFEKDGIFFLSGEWEFFWKKLLVTEKEKTKDLKHGYMDVPSTWNGKNINGEKLTGDGYASYRLRLKLPSNNLKMGIKLEDTGTSYSLYLNRSLVLQNGSVGKDKNSSQPQYRPSVAPIYHVEDNEIVVEVSNFHHIKGGFWETVKVGSLESLESMQFQSLITDSFLIGAFIIMGIYHFGLYLMGRKTIASLFFAVFCIIMIPRILTTNERMLFYFFPNFNWEIGNKLEYLSLYSIAPTLLLYLGASYKKYFSKIVSRIVPVVWVFMSGVVMVVPIKLYAHTLLSYELFSLSIGFYAIYVQFVATIKKEPGAVAGLLGVAIGLITGINDVLKAGSVIDSYYIAPYGVFSFLFFQSYMMALKSYDESKKTLLLAEDFKQTNISYSRFVPKEFLTLLKMHDINEVQLGNAIEKEMTILFSDIRSFSELSENMTPQENFDFLNSFFKRVGPVIREHRGFIDKYIGDGIMAIFPEKPEDAINAAIEMKYKVNQFNNYLESKGFNKISIGLGINTGKLMLGTIGERERMESTVISDSVNLAARMEGLTKFYGCSLLITEWTLLKLNDPLEYNFRTLDRVKVKGKKDIVSVIEIIDGDSEKMVKDKMVTKSIFEKGIHYYMNGEFEEAATVFRKILKSLPEDMVSKLYLTRMEYYKKNGMPLNWDGVEALDFK